MNFYKRLQQIIRERDITQYRIAKDLGISQTTVKNYQDGTTRPNSLILKQIADYLNVNLEWLLTGDGEMNKINDLDKSAPKSNLKYYNIDASAGEIDMLNLNNYPESRNTDIPGFNDCDIALNVWGDSMEPVLMDGHIVICKEWDQYFIHFGHIYLIITKDNHRMIKYLKKSPKDKYVICESANTRYEPFEIKFKEILKLYIVKGYIARLNL